MLVKAGLVGFTTVTVTTVHAAPVVHEPLPQDGYDFMLDYIVTPEEVISYGLAYCLRGLVWPNLDEEQIGAIALLAA